MFVAVRSCLNPVPLPNFQSDAEDIGVKITMNKLNILIFCAYISPGDSILLELFASNLLKVRLHSEKKLFLMLRDFNSSSTIWEISSDGFSTEATNVEMKYSNITDTSPFCELLQCENFRFNFG